MFEKKIMGLIRAIGCLVVLTVLWCAAQLLTATSAYACNYGNNGEVGGGCGNVGPPPPPPSPKPDPCASDCACSNSGGNEGPSGAGSGGDLGVGGSGAGDPVALFSGKQLLKMTDMTVEGTYPITLVRQYERLTHYDSPLGYGWAFNLDKRLYKYADNSVVIRTDCGTRNKFLFVAGSYQSQQDGPKATLTELGDGSFELTESEGGKEVYDSQGKLVAKRNLNGNGLKFTYDGRGKLPLTGSSPFSLVPAVPSIVSYDYRLTKIEEQLIDGTLTGNFVTFSYDDASGRLLKIAANDGREVSYDQDKSVSTKNGNLKSVTGLNGNNSYYDYTDSINPHGVTSIKQGSDTATPYVDVYDPATGQVVKQTSGLDVYDFVYKPLETAVTHTVKKPDNSVAASVVKTVKFDGGGLPISFEWVLNTGTKYKKVLTRNAKHLIEKEELSEWPSGTSAYVVMRTITYEYDTWARKTHKHVALSGGEIIHANWEYYDNSLVFGSKLVTAEETFSSLAPTKLFRTEYEYVDEQKLANLHSLVLKKIRKRQDDGSYQETTFGYNNYFQKDVVYLPGGPELHYHYSTRGKVDHIWLESGGVALPYYQVSLGFLANGNLSSITDAKGNVTNVVVDGLQHITQATNVLGETTKITYSGNQISDIEIGQTAADGEGQVTHFGASGGRGWPQMVQRKSDTGALVKQADYTYNIDGKPLTSTTYRDGIASTTSYQYDGLGRLVKEIDPSGNVTQYRVDAMGNRTAMIDAKNRETIYSYDQMDRLVSIEQKGVTPSAVTRMTYDAVGNLLSVTNPENHTTVYEYDTLSRLKQVAQSLGQTVKYFYDNAGRVDYMVKARGQKIDYSFASWGGLDHIDYYPTEAATASIKRVQFSYDYNGNMTSVSDNSISASPLYQYTYDPLNRIDVTTIGYLPMSVSIDDDYDRFGNRKRTVLNDGATATSSFVFNKLNELNGIALPGSQNYTLAYYQDAGLYKQLTAPSGVTSVFQFAGHNLVKDIAISGASVIDQLNYQYDATLNITAISSSRDGGTHSYAYDGIDRLSTVANPVGYGVTDESYTYDGVGNRQLTNSPAQYEYDGNNQILKSPGLTYGYDSDGNQTSRSDGSTFSFDMQNQLVNYSKSGTTAIYTYDPFGRRIRKSVNGVTTNFVWDGASLIGEYVGSARKKRYDYLPAGLNPIQMQIGADIYSAQADHLGTVRTLTNGAKAVVWSAKQSAFGVTQVNEDVDGNGSAVEFSFRFPGQYADGETGLYYNWHRYYDPSTGRYITSDPLGLAGGLNTYLYTYGNPNVYYDPLGLFCLPSWAIGGIGGSVGGAVGGFISGVPGGPGAALAAAGVGAVWGGATGIAASLAGNPGGAEVKAGAEGARRGANAAMGSLGGSAVAAVASNAVGGSANPAAGAFGSIVGGVAGKIGTAAMNGSGSGGILGAIPGAAAGAGVTLLLQSTVACPSPGEQPCEGK